LVARLRRERAMPRTARKSTAATVRTMISVCIDVSKFGTRCRIEKPCWRPLLSSRSPVTSFIGGERFNLKQPVGKFASQHSISDFIAPEKMFPLDSLVTYPRFGACRTHNSG
jgi:hypothetical protein